MQECLTFYKLALGVVGDETSVYFIFDSYKKEIGFPPKQHSSKESSYHHRRQSQ